MDSENIWFLFVALLTIGLWAYLIFMPIKQEAREGALINPWKRLIARSIDFTFYTLIAFILAFLGGFLLGMLGFSDISAGIIDSIFTILGMVIVIFAEPVILSKFQTTLGKYLLKLKIHSNEPITFSLAFKRYIRVLLRTLPIFSLITIPRSYRVLNKTGDTAYDRKLGITITSEKLTTSNIVVVVVVFLMSLAVNVLVNLAARVDLEDSISDVIEILEEDTSQNTLTIQEELEALVVELKDEMELPQMVDDSTQLFDLGSGEKKFIYFFKLINYNYDEIDIDFFLEGLDTDTRASQKNYYCNEENLLWYRMNDIALEYRYSAADDIFIGKNTHYSSQCNK